MRLLWREFKWLLAGVLLLWIFKLIKKDANDKTLWAICDFCDELSEDKRTRKTK